MSNQNRPIGIIDSGIGGFSVARRVRRQLPNENILYFGDGGNNPYGNHTAEEILSLTRYAGLYAPAAGEGAAGGL